MCIIFSCLNRTLEWDQKHKEWIDYIYLESDEEILNTGSVMG